MTKLSHRLLRDYSFKLMCFALAGLLILCGLALGQQLTFSDATGQLPVSVANSTSIDIGDVDGDGDLDLIIGRNPESNSILINNGTGSFTDKSIDQLPLTDGITNGIRLLDVDGDSDLDIFSANVGATQSRIWINDGQGTFADSTASNLPALSVYVTDAAFGDIDGDNDLDLVLSVSLEMSNVLLINNGSGVFADESSTRLIADDRVSSSVALGDLDDDGDLDMVVSNFSGGSQILINNGSGVFTDETSTRLGQGNDQSPATDVALGDVNGDGSLDIAFAVAAGLSDKLYINNGHGVFIDESITRLPGSLLAYSNGVEFGDVDSDGDLDILMANSGFGTDFLLLNDGTGFFVNQTNLLPGDTLSNVDARFIDVDDDGDLDIVGATLAGQDYFYLNLMSSGGGGAPPVITNTTNLPNTDVTSGVYSIRTTVYDNTGVQSVSLFYKVTGDSSFTEAAMSFIGGNLYRGVIPAQALGDTVNYYISATDISDSTSLDPPNAPDSSYSFSVFDLPPQISFTVIDGHKTNVTPFTLTGSVNDLSISTITIRVGLDSLDYALDNGQFSASIDLTEGNNVIVATAEDSLGQQGADSVTVVYDITGPVISSVSTLKTDQTSVIVGWVTDESGTSQIEYGLSETYGSLTTEDATLVLQHQAEITGLTMNTLYHFRVTSKDDLNNQSQSGDFMVTTLGPPTDNFDVSSLGPSWSADNDMFIANNELSCSINGAEPLWSKFAIYTDMLSPYEVRLRYGFQNSQTDNGSVGILLGATTDDEGNVSGYLCNFFDGNALLSVIENGAIVIPLESAVIAVGVLGVQPVAGDFIKVRMRLDGATGIEFDYFLNDVFQVTLADTNRKFDNLISYAGIAFDNRVDAQVDDFYFIPFSDPSADSLAIVSGENQQGFAGVTLVDPFVVKVTNPIGNPVSGVTLTYQVIDGNGKFSNDSTAVTLVTDPNGTASEFLTTGTQLGLNRVVVGGLNLNNSPVMFSVTTVCSDSVGTVPCTGNRVPIIAVPDSQTVNEGDTLTFIVTATDPDSTTPILSVDNLPQNSMFDSNTGNFAFTPDFTQSVGSPYAVTFVATDSEDQSLADTADVVITVLNVNRVPVANAGADTTEVKRNSLVTLDGSASSDVDGDSLRFSWNQIGGPTVTLDDSTAIMPTFTPTDVKDYVFVLSISDGIDPSLPDTIMVRAYMVGDPNRDGDVGGIADIVFLVNYRLGAGTEPEILDSGDANGDGGVGIADIVYLVNYKLGSGPPPVASVSFAQPVTFSEVKVHSIRIAGDVKGIRLNNDRKVEKHVVEKINDGSVQSERLDTLIVNNTMATSGDTDISVSISLKNSIDVGGFSFVLIYDPNALTFQPEELEDPSRVVRKTTRTENFEVFSANIDLVSGTINVLGVVDLVLPRNPAMAVGDGEIAEILFDVVEGMPSTEVEVSIQSGSFSDVSGSQEITPVLVPGRVSVEGIQRSGDVNGDGIVDVNDLIRAINLILGIGPPTSEIELEMADCNSDGAIDVADLVCLINRILGIDSGNN